MKTLFIIGLVFIATGVRSQTVTNIIIKVTTDVVVTGVSTNSSSTSLNLTASTAKDNVRINGLSWAYSVARANGFTNSFDNWIARVWAKDNGDSIAAAKLHSDNDLAGRQLLDLLNVNYDLLSAGDIANLNSIRAKSPVTQ